LPFARGRYRPTTTPDSARAVPALLWLLHSDIVPRRAAAVLALFRVTGEDFGLQPYRPPAADAAAIRRAELWWLQKGLRSIAADRSAGLPTPRKYPPETR